MKRKIIIIVLLLVSILVITNPSDQKYKNHMSMTEIKTKDLTADGVKNSVVFLDNFTIRSNYILFSTFKYVYQNEDKADRVIKYFGIFNQIFKVKDLK